MRIETNRELTVADLLAQLKDADPATVLVFGKTLKSDQINECWCGCGGATKSKFVPGHDSKFHSLAKRAARGQAEIPESFVNDEAEADFAMWFERELPIWEAGQPLRDLKAANKANKATVVKSVEPATDLETEEAQALLAEMASVED